MLKGDQPSNLRLVSFVDNFNSQQSKIYVGITPKMQLFISKNIVRHLVDLGVGEMLGIQEIWNGKLLKKLHQLESGIEAYSARAKTV